MHILLSDTLSCGTGIMLVNDLIVRRVKVDGDATMSCTEVTGAGVAQLLCNGLPRNDTGFDSRWGRCNKPPQGTVNGGAVSKLPRRRCCDVKHNQPTKGNASLPIYSVSSTLPEVCRFGEEILIRT